MRPCLALFVAVALFAAQAGQQPAASSPVRGFAPEQWGSQRAWEEKAVAIPEPSRVRAYMERMAAEPHHAGSPASRRVAEYTLGLLREWGLDARIEEFEALLPYPTARVLQMVEPSRYEAKLKEPEVAGDRDSGDANQLPSYNAYAASGDVTAPLVYVNYGIPEDYAYLKSKGIDVKGKIVIARYGKSWRGTKPKVAHENGAAACLIYSDPRDDGYFRGDVYPKGPYRPAHGVQRGSVMDMPLYVGDPLSPGWSSEKGSKRLALEEAASIMKIPVLPISHADAQPLLEKLEGPVAPEAWRGALPLTYHIGPGPAKVRLKVDSDWATRPLYNVIATIPGSEHPDQWVIYGNHHDAWVNGANDPVSGAAALLETARTLAELRKQGWTPKRTIVLALWDAEEFGLVGSTEWVEKHAEELSRKAVAYINSDSNGKGVMRASGSSTLQQFVSEILRDLPDPVKPKTILEALRERRADAAQRNRPADFRLAPLGAGSDYVAFVHHKGIASLNLSFSGDDSGGIYHSVYDSLHWYKRFSDGEFVHGKGLAQVMSTALMRLAGAQVLPFEFGGFVKAMNSYLGEIEKEARKRSGKVSLRELRRELARVAAGADAYEKQLTESIGQVAKAGPAHRAELNRVIYQTERALTLTRGLPGRPWYKHQISAPGMYTGYGAKTLPGIREAVEAGRWQEANEQAGQVAAALGALAEQIQKATALFEQAE